MTTDAPAISVDTTSSPTSTPETPINNNVTESNPNESNSTPKVVELNPSREPLENESIDDYMVRMDALSSQKDAEYQEKAKREENGEEEVIAETKEDVKPTKLQLKVNGKVIEHDLNDLDATTELLQKGHAATKAMQHASAVRKQAEAFIEALKTNPEEVLSHPALGIDLKEFAQDYLYKQILLEKMTPEERASHQEKQELESFRKQKQEEERNRQEKEMSDLKEKYRGSYQEKFKEALDKAEIPKSKWAIGQMAYYMKTALERGYKNIDPLQIAGLVKRDWIETQKSMLSSVPDEALVESVGRDVYERLKKKHELELQAAAKQNSPYQNSPDKTPKKNETPKKIKRSPYDFL